MELAVHVLTLEVKDLLGDSEKQLPVACISISKQNLLYTVNIMHNVQQILMHYMGPYKLY